MMVMAPMLYLSRLCLNARERGVRRDLADCQALHRTLFTAFPQVPDAGGGARAALGLLYRVEPTNEDGGVPVLVQSYAVPEWSRLSRGYLLPEWDATEGYAVKSLGPFYRQLQTGMALRFRLHANPTRCVAKRDDPLCGKRVELRHEEEQLAWLARKGADGGFRLLDVRAAAGIADVRASHGANVLGFRRDAPEGRRRMTFGSVLFDGRLTITDTKRFLQTLTLGIGSGKAYGFGLLSVAPV
jgi:CRISPR system Cascade subunit CasE